MMSLRGYLSYLRKNNLAFLVLVVILIAISQYGCKVLKRVMTQKETTEQHQSVLDQAQMMSQRQLQTDQHFLEWRLDSANRNDMVMIWPKGKFNFSLEHGFEGEADQMVLTSKLQQSEASLKMKDSLAKEESVFEAGQLHKSEEKKDVKSTIKEESPAFWPITVVALIAIAGLLLFIYKLTNR